MMAKRTGRSSSAARATATGVDGEDRQLDDIVDDLPLIFWWEKLFLLILGIAIALFFQDFIAIEIITGDERLQHHCITSCTCSL